MDKLIKYFFYLKDTCILVYKMFPLESIWRISFTVQFWSLGTKMFSAFKHLIILSDEIKIHKIQGNTTPYMTSAKLNDTDRMHQTN